MTKVKVADPMPSVPDIFLETLRKTLEHIADTAWLEKNSPLTSVFFSHSTNRSQEQPYLQLSNRSEIDSKLRLIWRDWTDPAKTPLQQLIWDTVERFPVDVDDQLQMVLLLTYFDLDQPKQSQVIKTLAVGRSTYYRHLERAIKALGFEIVKHLKPALRLEQPKARQLVGRDAEFQAASNQLKLGAVVHLVGGSGLGKTSLGASLAESWEHAVFWYTFRPHLTDSLEQMLFAFAFFLHQQGASGLWLYLSSLDQPIQPDRALMAINQHLADLALTPPLICFDEVDLLLPDDLNDSESHIQLRGFIEEWAKMDRGNCPILCIGQKLLLEPEASGLILLNHLKEIDLKPFMRNLSVEIETAEIKNLFALTKGNPLLLKLVAILAQQGASLSESIGHVKSTLTLDWFWQNLRHRLSQNELILLQEISVFRRSVPRAGWQRHHKLIDKLSSIGILEETSADGIGLHPAIRRMIYAKIPPAIKTESHLAAGHFLAERSWFTSAAYHFIEAGRPEIAIWTWYIHRQAEIDQGQSRSALMLLTPLTQIELQNPTDQKALALLVAQLSSLSGDYASGLSVLNQVDWPDGSISSAHAHEFRGLLFSQMGETDHSLSEYRKSLEAVENLRLTHEIQLRTQLARRAHTALSDIEKASTEVTLAKFDLDILQGRLADAKGDYNAARIHYANALSVANKISNPSRLASLHGALGVMEARYGHVEAAVDNFKKAGEYHNKCGNVVYARGLSNTNISFTYLAKRRYAEALEPGENALEFYKEINHPYWLATNEANLAEISFYLGRHADARQYAQSGLSREEPSVRPYCLYVLAHLARAEKEYATAETLANEAIDAAQKNEDPWAEAPAFNTLGEVLRDKGQLDQARTSFQSALEIWEQIGIQHEIEHSQKLIDCLKNDVDQSA